MSHMEFTQPPTKRLRSNLDDEIVREERQVCSKYQIDFPNKHELDKTKNGKDVVKAF